MVLIGRLFTADKTTKLIPDDFQSSNELSDLTGTGLSGFCYSQRRALPPPLTKYLHKRFFANLDLVGSRTICAQWTGLLCHP